GRHAVGEHLACRLDVTRALRQPAADHDDAIGPDCRSLIDHLYVVVDRRLTPGGVRGGEKSAAAVAGHFEAVRPDDARRLIDAGRLDMIAPRRDGRNAMPKAGFDAGLQIELLAH